MKRRRPVLLLLLLVVNLWSGSAGLAQVTTKPVPPVENPMEARNSQIVQATLLNATEGYVTSGDRIFYTTTLGKNWTDITPKEAAGDLMTATFVSPSDGLAYFSRANDDSGAATVDVFHTSTRGGSWSRLSSVSGGDALSSFGYQLSTSFVDEQHGWLSALKTSSAAFSFSDLFSTSDGGRSWRSASSPPVFGQLKFISPTTGFLLGGFDESELYRTSDAGKTWSRIQFAEEVDMNLEKRVTLSLPRFDKLDNQIHGTLILSVVTTGYHTTTTAYETSDGGVTWSKAAGRSLATPLVPKTGTEGRDPLVVQVQAGSNLYTSHVSGTAKIFTLPKTLANPSVSHASFKDDQTGWIVVHSSYCAAARTGCTQSDTLMLTIDGGATYSDVTPALTSSSNTSDGNTASPEVIVPTYLGQTPYMAWDQQVAPTFDQLDDWGYTASLYAFSVYLGGSHYSSAAAAQSGLTPLYAEKFACDNYSIMPIWVGPQANTSKYSAPIIYSDPNQAYNQGYSEAQQAVYASAIKLGIVSGIIYYDLEQYTTPTALNVRRFISGWVQGLHANGWQAGVYFNPSDWTDIASASPVPDDVWVVKVYNDFNITSGVYGLTPLPDTYWSSQQRIRQYTTPVSQMYGVHTHQVDLDLVLGPTTTVDFSLIISSNYNICSSSTPPLTDICSPVSHNYFYGNPACGQVPDCQGPDNSSYVTPGPCAPSRSGGGSGSGCSDVCDPSCSDYNEVTCECYLSPTISPTCNEICPQYDPFQCNGLDGVMPPVLLPNRVPPVTP